MNEFFKQIEVKVPNRSGEDLSFQHLLTAKCGTLVPILWHEVIPGTKVHLKSAISASLPPLASDTFMRCKLKLEAFFVPFRQVMGSFEHWITGQKLLNPSDSSEIAAMLKLAYIDLNDLSKVGPGSLADYLGWKITTQSVSSNAVYVDPFPFLTYHWIWDRMYRNSKIQRSAFSVPASNFIANNSLRNAAFIPYLNNSTGATIVLGSNGSSERLADGVFLSDLRQRNFDADYFTNMTLNPQSVATPAAVQFSVDAQGDGEFTIAALRAQNSLQQYLERQNLAGFRLTEWVKANYGVNLAEGMAQMPLFLGRQSIDVYSKGVESTANVAGTTNNPFGGSTGARYGSAYALGNDTLIDEFEAKEPGTIMVMCSLVPKVTYATGIDPQLLHFRTQSSQGDIANPLLQNVGQQAVSTAQLCGDINNISTFGYTDRYSEFMTKFDRVSGLLRDGQSLQSFALQRSFPTAPSLSSSFLEIPTNYLDQVSAVTGAVSNYGIWIDSFFEFKISHPLQKYSIPSLQDPAYEHGKGVIISRSGQVIN